MFSLIAMQLLFLLFGVLVIFSGPFHSFVVWLRGTLFSQMLPLAVCRNPRRTRAMFDSKQPSMQKRRKGRMLALSFFVSSMLPIEAITPVS